LIESGPGVFVTGGGVFARSDAASGSGVFIAGGSAEDGSPEAGNAAAGAGVSMPMGAGVSIDTGSGVSGDAATDEESGSVRGLRELGAGFSLRSSRMSPIASSIESCE